MLKDKAAKIIAIGVAHHTCNLILDLVQLAEGGTWLLDSVYVKFQNLHASLVLHVTLRVIFTCSACSLHSRKGANFCEDDVHDWACDLSSVI